MRAIHRKLFRDLWKIKGQVVAIAAVIGVGVMMFIAYLSTFDSLRATQAAFYERYRFGDVFAAAKRAPNHLAARIAEIPGVGEVATRVVADVTLDVEGMNEPVTGRLISVPEVRAPMINDLALLEGRYLEPDRADEVIVIEGFALAHDLEPGDSVTAVINGRRRELRIVGIALCPEYVYVIRPGEMMPDESRFGVFWMGYRALSTAMDIEGGFNDVSLRLLPEVPTDEVIDRLDRLLEPYGGLGAIPRDLQISTWYLDKELEQLQGFGFFIPAIFLGVAAFLLNVVLTRVVSVQREQIAALKALGYGNWEIGWHYTLWSLTVAWLGGGLGLVGGRFLGMAMIGLYNDYFRFPFLEHQLSAQVIASALGIALGAAVFGAVGSVRHAVSLPPAEAMRPEPPARYRQSLLERLGLQRWLSPPARMVLRNLSKRPLRTLASVTGIAFSCGLLIIGFFFHDAIDELTNLQFSMVQRQDITVTFVEPRGSAALYEVERLPGVTYAEPSRTVPVRLRAGHRSRQTSITGLVAGPELHRVVNTDYQVEELPADGLLLTGKLAEVMGIERGDTVILEVLEGRRPVRHVVVTDLVDEYMGMSAYMEATALSRLMREGGVLSGAYLQVDPAVAEVLYGRLKALPVVAGVALKEAAISAFDEQMDEMMGVFIFFNILFASVIAVGVVYNAARIALSERSHELASMRVLGFTRAEISSILLGELATVSLLAIPLGLLIGYGLAGMLVMGFDTELYRFPLVVTPRSYAIAALIVLMAATLSGLVVRRRLDRLDLIEVLKNRTV